MPTGWEADALKAVPRIAERLGEIAKSLEVVAAWCGRSGVIEDQIDDLVKAVEEVTKALTTKGIATHDGN